MTATAAGDAEQTGLPPARRPPDEPDEPHEPREPQDPHEPQVPREPVEPDERIELDEPDEPGRIHRQPDLMRLLFETLMIVVVVTLGKFGVQTTSGVEFDVHEVELVPPVLLGGVTVLMNIVTAVIPVGLAVERLVRRDARRVADAVIAAFLASGVAGTLNLWITSAYAPSWLPAELTRRLELGATTSPLHVYLVTVVAFLTILGFNDRPTLRTFTWVCVGVYATAALVGGDAGLVGLIVSLLLGRAVAFGWRYCRGVVNDTTTGRLILASLNHTGVDPVSCRWVAEHDDVRRYEVRCADGRLLDVRVLDRDRSGIGVLYRLYRRIRLSGPAQRRNLLSVRRTVEHEALMSYALAAADIKTPKLAAVRELATGAGLTAVEHTRARPLAEVPDDEFGDALIERVFCTVWELNRRQIAHRRLSLDSILVDGQGEIWLVELRDGEVAADDLQRLLDVAGTMAALALKAGPERTVRIGARVLGAARIGAALPMLQPVVLTRGTRAAMAESKGLLQRLREQILELRPHAPAAEPVKLERLRPRTFLAVAACCFAVYVLMLEVSRADDQSRRSLPQLIAAASPGWLLIAAAAAALTYVAAAMQLEGYIPEKLPVLQNMMVQLASSFVALFAPAAVGGATLNVRFLQKRGIPTGPAVSAIGACQAVAFVVHIALIAAFASLAGSGHIHDEASAVVIAILLALAVLVMVTLAVQPLRRFAKRRLAFFEGSLPRLLDVVQNPRKLLLALGGTLGISLLNALCLWSCLNALGNGGRPSYPTTALIYLTVQAASVASPTPAGIGVVELGLGGALAGPAGIAKQSAVVVAVLVYRLLTAYLPAATGFLALHRLRRTNAV